MQPGPGFHAGHVVKTAAGLHRVAARKERREEGEPARSELGVDCGRRGGDGFWVFLCSLGLLMSTPCQSVRANNGKGGDGVGGGGYGGGGGGGGGGLSRQTF